jgi:hypothetical protein
LTFTPTLELLGKRLALLKEAVPHASRVAVLSNPENPSHARELGAVQAAARQTVRHCRSPARPLSSPLPTAAALLRRRRRESASRRRTLIPATSRPRAPHLGAHASAWIQPPC